MRVVWKDSNPRPQKLMRYRGHLIEGYGDGWVVADIPEDKNIYKHKNSALNAIDKYEGGYGQKGAGKRKEEGIQIIGKRIMRLRNVITAFSHKKKRVCSFRVSPLIL